MPHSKKADIELSTIAEIILILIAAGIIIGIFSYAAGRASEKTSESLCRGFNAIRFGTKVDKGPITLNVVPRACKTIDKGDFPGKDYKDYPGGLKEGAKAELRNSIAKCWWMWLEGKQPNMFDTSTIALENKCFICYDFSLQSGVDIKIPELIASLDYPYEAVDSTDRCAVAGEGGKCMPSCDKSSNLPRATDSTRCRENQKCCIAEDAKDECINKGGSCEPIEGYVSYDKWSCKKGSCHVKKENFVSYLDYVQGTKGATGGAGFLVYEDKLKDSGMTTKKKYAITLISPGNTPRWDTAAWGGATLVLGAATIASAVYVPPILKQTATEAAAVGTYASYKMTEKSGAPAGYNFIYISEYDDVKKKCQIEAGVDER